MSDRKHLSLASLAAAGALGVLLLLSANCWVDDHYRCDPTDAGAFSACEDLQTCTPRGICAWLCGPEHPQGVGDCGASEDGGEVCGPDGYCILDRAGATPDGGTDDGGGTEDGGTEDGGEPDGGSTDGGDTDGGEADGGGLPAHCTNTLQDADELAMDCGGSCPACGPGASCAGPGSCGTDLHCLCGDLSTCTERLCQPLRVMGPWTGVHRAVLDVDPGNVGAGRYGADLVFATNDSKVEIRSPGDNWITRVEVSADYHPLGAFPATTRNPNGALEIVHTGAGPQIIHSTLGSFWAGSTFCSGPGNLETARGAQHLYNSAERHILAGIEGSGPYTHQVGDCATGTWAPYTAFPGATVDDNTRLSLALDPVDALHLAFRDTGGSLIYQSDSSNPVSTSGGPPTYDLTGDPRVAVSAAAGNLGEVFIGFLDANGEVLRLVHGMPGDLSWTETDVDLPIASQRQPGLGLDLAVDASGLAHLVWLDPQRNTLVYARPEGGSWDKIDLFTYTGIPTDVMLSLDVDPDGYPHITFVGENSTLHYLYLGP